MMFGSLVTWFEVISQMLDVYDATYDAAFAGKSVARFADAILTFYQLHYPHDESGHLRIAPGYRFGSDDTAW